VAHLGFTVQKMAEQIKMLFGINTLGSPWNIVLKVGLDPHREGEVAQFYILEPPPLFRMAEA